MTNPSTQRHALVTGGCGFVGRHLVNALAERGDKVTVIDIGAKAFRPDVHFIDADIRNAKAVAAACAGVDVVYHNASVVHTKQNQQQTVWDINLKGSEHVLAGCREHHVPKLVYVSSASVVYDGGDIENGDESLPYPTTSQAPYADSKIAAEKLILHANGKDGLSTVSIRPHVVYGPGDSRFLPAVLARAEAGKLKFKVGKGDKLSDFTYVSNLVDALLSAADKLQPGSLIAGQAYFITNGEPNTFFGFANMILQELGYPPVTRSVPEWLAYAAATIAETIDTLKGGAIGVESGMTRFAVRYMCTHHYFSIDKARRDLGYVPKVSLREGITKTVASLDVSSQAA